MPKRGDLVVLESVCEGAMEGLNSGAKYFVRIGENKLTITPYDILDMESLACMVTSHLKHGGHDIDIYFVRQLKDACDEWLEVRTESIVQENLIEEAAKTIVEEMTKGEDGWE